MQTIKATFTKRTLKGDRAWERMHKKENKDQNKNTDAHWKSKLNCFHFLADRTWK